MDPSNAVGRLALAMASSSALFLALATATFGRQSIFCDNTSCHVDLVLWSLPLYAALLALVLSAVLIAAALVRAHVGPPAVRIVALGAAIVRAVAYVVVSILSLDDAWVGAFSGRLTPAPPTPLLPSALRTIAPSLWPLSSMSIGIWIALTSLLTSRLHAPPPLVIFGWITGVAVAAFVPLAMTGRFYAVDMYALPAEFVALTVWAFVLGLALVRRSPVAA
jgi:hypothetical protein